MCLHTAGRMKSPSPEHTREHEHTPTTEHSLRQRDGVPYQVVATVCASCGQVLSARELKRAAT